MADSEKHFELAVGIAIGALNAMLLVNGGAATALIALMDKTDAKHNYTSAVICFAAGAIFTVVGYCFGYFSQLNYANHRMSNENEQRSAADHSHKWHRIWQCLTLVAVGLALAAMVLGLLVAAHLSNL